ncbi:DNA cytosine methyltransferase [Ferrimonas sediminicola]|uniref:DNA (cytosine-5-)-methyltransferase n=1 Tax=Ferrimonas sediminicola TaxID=2569538 RepID=A0A4U1B660_9GAMM|nr:DNA cytosine methyltransferase [Ferrimonas sediminicola]TKB46010.1 DNA cytosine methyltransferase [Ferrimonas sediminicola]
MNTTDNKPATNSPRIAAVDLFCGVGGLTHGMQRKGIPVLAGVDLEASCKFPYEANNNAKFICKSVTEITSQEISQYYEGADIRVLVGCAPCQTFSNHTQKNKKRQEDSKWSLLYSFLDQIKAIRPDIVSMENVAELARYEIFDDFVLGLETEGYWVSHQVVNAANYGVPQRRRRLVLLASRFGPISLAESERTEKQVTVRDVIAGLPKIRAGETHPSDSLHHSSCLSPINMARIKQSKPGGTWKDWDESLLAECHKKPSGSTYSSVYGRMEWDKLCPTITTQFYSFGTGRFGHPEQNRALSLREGAMMQTFPQDYQFFRKGEKFYTRHVGRMIGNAVPVKLGELVGQSILEHVYEYTGNE